MSIRAAVVACVVLSLAVPASAVDAPVIRPGECLYLLGAPAGAPAATTEVSYDGTEFTDTCSHIPHAEVNRDAPHRMSVWIERRNLLPGEPNGCFVAAFSANEFSIPADIGAAWLFASASGDATGLMEGAGAANFDERMRATLELQALAVAPDGSERVLAARNVLEREVSAQAVMSVENRWSSTLSVPVAGGGTYRLRLRLQLQIFHGLVTMDFGTPASGRGAGYDSLSVCVTRMSDGVSPQDDQLERDLYDKRCMPSMWLPAARGGKLDAAASLVDRLTDAAVASGEAGVNAGVARERAARAATEIASGQYQRACRDLSEAVHMLTTP